MKTIITLILFCILSVSIFAEENMDTAPRYEDLYWLTKLWV
jgi:hypothetical protein